jgi:membrane-associated PAP2 superfamily phosphatase
MASSLISPIMSIAVGAAIVSVVTIAFGGTFLLRVVAGTQETNELQKSFFRAGHAHAGVLVMLGVVLAVLGNCVGASPAWADAGAIAVLVAAILMPAGFFLSVLGHDPARPNRMIVSLWVGAALLVSGVITSGVATLMAGINRF